MIKSNLKLPYQSKYHAKQTVDEHYAFDVYVLVEKPLIKSKLSSRNKGM